MSGGAGGTAESGAGSLALPLVSVVIPTYERVGYLSEAVASVLAQTWPHLEVIVSDNASPTDPGPMLAAFADPRIRLYRNAANLGVGGNLEVALARANGTYVAILGDDDLWEPQFVETLVAPLEHNPRVAVAFCDHDVVDGAGVIDAARSDAVSRRFGRDLLEAGEHRSFAEIALVRRSICIFSGAILRRDAAPWSALPREVMFGADMYIAYLAVRSGGSCYYCPQRLAHYRFHAGSLTSVMGGETTRRLANARASLFLFDLFLADPSLAAHRRYFELKRGLNALRVVTLLLRRGEVAAGVRELGAALRRGLWRPRMLADALGAAMRPRRARA